MGQIDKRLAELGITLPVPAKPVANYVGWVRTGNLVYTAGQVSLKDGNLLRFGPEYLIPKPFDPRLIVKIAPAVAKAAMESGVATRPIRDFDGYRQQLQQFVSRPRTTWRKFVRAAHVIISSPTYFRVPTLQKQPVT